MIRRPPRSTLLTHSFPTRRSSDLEILIHLGYHRMKRVDRAQLTELIAGELCPGGQRSEEHTSELQSLMRISYAVFCLKKTKHTYSKQLIMLQTHISNSTIKEN